MKNILLRGYVEDNLGDDLFFEYVARRYPNVNFDLCAISDKNITFKDIPNIDVLYPSSWRLFLYRVILKLLRKRISLININKKYDVFLTVGGSIFMQNKHWKSEIKEFRGNLKLGNTIILGSNFGPFEDEDYVDLYKAAFLELKDICFRDEYSYNLFKDNLNVRKAPDILFALKPIVIKEERKIFISVIKPSHKKGLDNAIDEKYYLEIAKLCKKYIQMKYEIVISSFSNIQGDGDAINYIYKMLDSEEKNSVRKVLYNGQNRKDILNEIASSEYIIATRFHAMVLGWIHNKKVLPILYSGKMLNVIQDINFNGIYFDLRDKNLDFEVNLEDIRLLNNVKGLAKDSLEHFKILDKILLGK